MDQFIVKSKEKNLLFY